MRRNPVAVFKGRVTDKWTFSCEANVCTAPTFQTYGRGTVHWELAMHEACDHIREFHIHEHVGHDYGARPHIEWSDTGSHLSLADADTQAIPVQRSGDDL